MDMMVDATLMLWKRCKEVFARYQTGSTDNPKYLHRMENAGKVNNLLTLCSCSAVFSHEVDRLKASIL